jgi:hypothetical protein
MNNIFNRQSDNSSNGKKKHTLLKVVAIILFPIAAGLFFIWPSRLFKGKMKKGWRILLWAIYTPVALWLVFLKIFCVALLISESINPTYVKSGITRENVTPTEYRTKEDFYKLTGVEFPELQLVDSLSYDEGILGACWWDEYKFIATKGLKTGFFKRLDVACQKDSEHWSYTEGSFADTFDPYYRSGLSKDGQMIYSYWIYPDTEPVDRTKGVCDRMVTMDDGSLVQDWDGGFISVEVQKDTVVLRKGWLR